MTNLFFDAGSMLTVTRGGTTNKLGDVTDKAVSHQIGPCGIVDSRGNVNLEEDGTARWVGTVTVEVQIDSDSGELPDVKVTDQIILPNGDTGIVIQPPEVPRNPFTGWVPFLRFSMSTPGYKPVT